MAQRGNLQSNFKFSKFRWKQKDPAVNASGSPKKKKKKRAASLVGDSLEDVTVELFLPVSKELANHLPTQAFPLEQEVGHTHRSVRNKVSFYQILNALLWFSADRAEEERGRGGGRGA